MKNKEKYKLNKLGSATIERNDISQLIFLYGGESIFEVDGTLETIVKSLLNWLEQEYIEPIILTEDEKVILKNVDNDFKWMAKDKDGWLLFSKVKPIYDDGCLCVNGYLRDLNNVIMFSHLFQFIKWEDEEPYNIDELLKQNGVER